MHIKLVNATGVFVSILLRYHAKLRTELDVIEIIVLKS